MSGGRLLALAGLVVATGSVLVGCGGGSDGQDGTVSGGTAVVRDSAPGGGPVGDQPYPEVVAVAVTPAGGSTVRFDVTISSPYDSPERYADAWRVLAPDGTVLGVRELTHPHADEQPFTRSDTFDVPDGIAEVTVEGRDLVNGWGGTTATVPIPDR